jgi:hypothetical protein
MSIPEMMLLHLINIFVHEHGTTSATAATFFENVGMHFSYCMYGSGTHQQVCRLVASSDVVAWGFCYAEE